MTQKFFEIIPTGTRFDFMKAAPYFLVASAVMVLVSVILIFTRGFNYSVDFKGGTEVHVRFHKGLSAGELREALTPLGLSETLVQEVGEEGAGEFLIRVETFDLKLEGFKAQLQNAVSSVDVPGAGKGRVRYAEDRIYVTYDAPVEPVVLKNAMERLQIRDLRVDSVFAFGRATDNEYMVQFAGVASRIINAIQTRFGRETFEVLRIEQVGPRVGRELRMQAVGAVLISIVFILIYVWFRFELEFAPGGVIALVHDAMIILGVFSLFRLSFDLSVVAAVLTIIGFSINDTIVIFDRIRENLKKTKDADFGALINESVNQTLGRTILTSGTVLLASIPLMIWGGPIIFNFALAFTIGIVAGSYSTIVIASPLTLYLRKYLQRKRPAV